MKVAVIGDLAVDIKGYYYGTIKPGENIMLNKAKINPGGVAGNITYYLIKLKHQVAVFGAVGDDMWSRFIMSDLENLGVDRSNIKIVNDAPTGFFAIILDINAERTMVGSRGANEKLEVLQEELLNTNPDWIHLSGYSLLNKKGKEILHNVQKTAKKLGINYSIDLEGIGSTGVNLSLYSSIVLCNEGTCNEKNTKGSMITVIKAGSSGCYIIYSGEIIQHRALAVKAKDTTGAGDAFDAAFIHAYWKTKDADLACEFANRVASIKVAKIGNRVNIPFGKLLKEFDLS
ncbi:MAG: carbohydrate kinase family protein [bacterium]